MSVVLAWHLFDAEFGRGGEDSRRNPEGRPTGRVDPVLAERVRRGDETAFAELFNVLYPALVGFAVRYCHSEAMAEDAVQDVFAKVWERRAELTPRVSVAAYFYNAVRNRVLNLAAHDTLIDAHSADASAIVSEVARQAIRPPSPDELLMADELAALAASRVGTLSPRLQEIYRLSREDDLSPAEIAEALGTTTQTIYVQMGRIMRTLYPALAEWFRED